MYKSKFSICLITLCLQLITSLRLLLFFSGKCCLYCTNYYVCSTSYCLACVRLCVHSYCIFVLGFDLLCNDDLIIISPLLLHKRFIDVSLSPWFVTAHWGSRGCPAVLLSTGQQDRCQYQDSSTSWELFIGKIHSKPTRSQHNYKYNAKHYVKLKKHNGHLF